MSDLSHGRVRKKIHYLLPYPNSAVNQLLTSTLQRQRLTATSGFSGSTLEAWTWPDMKRSKPKRARFMGKSWRAVGTEPQPLLSQLVPVCIYDIYIYGTYIISLYVIYTSWCFQPSWAIYLVKLDHFPKVRRNIGPTSGIMPSKCCLEFVASQKLLKVKQTFFTWENIRGKIQQNNSIYLGDSGFLKRLTRRWYGCFDINWVFIVVNTCKLQLLFGWAWSKWICLMLDLHSLRRQTEQSECHFMNCKFFHDEIPLDFLMYVH